MNRIPCPQCGENNFENSPVCWACGVPMRKQPSATTPPPGGTIHESPGPANTQSPLPAGAQHAVPKQSVPDLEQPAPSLPADRPPASVEAASLRDKPWVTPPVDTPEKPANLAEAATYAGAWLTSLVTGVRDSLNEYDRIRGRKSGGFSSFGCLVYSFIAIAVIGVTGVLARLLVDSAGRR